MSEEEKGEGERGMEGEGRRKGECDNVAIVLRWSGGRGEVRGGGEGVSACSACHWFRWRWESGRVV